jgi:hemolysin III
LTKGRENGDYSRYPTDFSKNMTKTIKSLSPEEIANTITHGLGLALSLIGFAILLVLAWRTGNYWHKISCSIYGASLVLLYAASTCYHAARGPRAKKLLRVADHCGIYLLIAGSYTPFVLGPLRESIGWHVFLLVWGVALAGIFVRAVLGAHFRILTVVSYVALGWGGALLIKPLATMFPVTGLAWVIAGGVAYTLGIIFYGGKFWRYNHAVWHVFVLTGSLCHFWAVINYILR